MPFLQNQLYSIRLSFLLLFLPYGRLSLLSSEICALAKSHNGNLKPGPGGIGFWVFFIFKTLQ